MKNLLLFLRLILLALLFLSFLDYSFIRNMKRQRPVSLFVVVDSSLSMSLASRQKDAELAAQRLVSQKSGGIRYHLYHFSDTLHPFTDFTALSAKGEQSAYRETLSKIMEESWKHHPDAVFFISDGADTQNTPYEDLLQSFHESKIPFYTVYAGSENSFPDVHLLDVQVPPVVKVGEKVNVQSILSQQGFTGNSAAVRMDARGFLQQRKSITLRPQYVTSMSFELRVTKPGVYVGKTTVLPFAGEKGTQNNQKYFSFVALKDKWNTLFVYETLTWEYSFLKKFLASHPKLKVKSIWLRPDEKSKISFLSKEIPQNDFVIFGDVSCDVLSHLMNKTLSSLVLVSDSMKENCIKSQSFLPFAFTRAGFQKDDEEVYSVSLKHSPLFSGIDWAYQRLADTLLLTELVPVRMRKGAKALLEAESLKGDKHPLYVTMDTGAKKSGYFFSSSTWRWAFSKDKGMQDAYVAVWRTILDGYIKKQKPAFEIYTERKMFSVNERGKFFIAFSGGSEQNPVFSSKLLLSSGKTMPLGFSPENSEQTLFSAENDLREEGKYSLIVTAKAGSKNIGTKKETFTVKKFPKDYEYSTGNPDALRRMAEMTGGKYFTANQLEQIKNTMSSVKNIQEERKSIKITRSPFFFALLLFLFCTDIFIRKRAGFP